MSEINELLTKLFTEGGSDLHISENHVPMMRVNGKLIKANDHVLDAVCCREMISELMTEEHRSRFKTVCSYDFSYFIPGVARYRCNVFYHQSGIGAVFRLIPSEIKTIIDLGLPAAITDLANCRRGFVLVTGPTGSGKSTTLAAMITHINRTREGHIITLEDPIEFVHKPIKCRISQREIGVHSKSFAAALRSALREDADVILVGEMRNLETISLALTAAETGVLVFGTLHTNSAPKTVTRIIDVFPENQRELIRIMLSKSVSGIVAQQLVNRKDQKGRVPVIEILKGSIALGNIIREGRIDQIQTIIDTGKGEGMKSMDQALAELVDGGVILERDAYLRAIDKSKFISDNFDEKMNAVFSDYGEFQKSMEREIEYCKKNRNDVGLMNIAFVGMDLFYDVASKRDIDALVDHIVGTIVKSIRIYDICYCPKMPKNILVMLGQTNQVQDVAQRFYDMISANITSMVQKKYKISVAIGYALLSSEINNASEFISETQRHFISTSPG